MNMKRILLIVFAVITSFTQAQIKKKTQTTQKPKAEKKWVNPVKLTKEERNRPYMDEVLKTKDSLTPKEAERRRKNIAIGNPFAKYGVYPKIATLSKGKYLEFHDTDSIVVIGSVRYNTKKGNIIEVREVDLSDPDAQPIGDTHGRWMSPDPLSEEFSNWTPYNYAVNNPIFNTDPTGMAASPIFDEQGTLLGTDDQGVKGSAIIMDKKDFKQGMAHSVALEKGTLASNLPEGSVARKSADSFVESASSRPDYDGQLTFNEANSWARGGSASAQQNYGNGNLFVDASKIDTSKFDYQAITSENKKGNYFFNFLSYGSATTNTLGNYLLESDNTNTPPLPPPQEQNNDENKFDF